MLFQPTKLIRCFTLGLAISMVGVSTGFADISYSDLSVELQAQAKAIMVEGDPPKARNLLVQALTADPSNASAYSFLLIMPKMLWSSWKIFVPIVLRSVSWRRPSLISVPLSIVRLMKKPPLRKTRRTRLPLLPKSSNKWIKF